MREKMVTVSPIWNLATAWLNSAESVTIEPQRERRAERDRLPASPAFAVSAVYDQGLFDQDAGERLLGPARGEERDDCCGYDRDTNDS
jgi:hypothetical protein